MSILLEAVVLTLMIVSTRCFKSDKGQIVDAGVDLNSTHSYGEYVDLLFWLNDILFLGITKTPLFSA